MDRERAGFPPRRVADGGNSLRAESWLPWNHLLDVRTPDLGGGAPATPFEQFEHRLRVRDPAGIHRGPDALQRYCQACTALKGVITCIWRPDSRDSTEYS